MLLIFLDWALDMKRRFVVVVEPGANCAKPGVTDPATPGGRLPPACHLALANISFKTPSATVAARTKAAHTPWSYRRRCPATARTTLRTRAPILARVHVHPSGQAQCRRQHRVGERIRPWPRDGPRTHPSARGPAHRPGRGRRQVRGILHSQRDARTGPGARCRHAVRS